MSNAEKVAVHAEIKILDGRLAEIRQLTGGGDEYAHAQWKLLWHLRESYYRRLRSLSQ